MVNSFIEILSSPVLLSAAIISLVQVFLFYVCVPAACVILLTYVTNKKVFVRILVILLVVVSLFANSKVDDFVGQKEVVYRRLLFMEFKYEHEISGFIFTNSLRLDEPIYQFQNSNVYVFFDNGKLFISNYSDVYSYKLSNTEIGEYNKDSEVFLESYLGNLLNKRKKLYKFIMVDS